MPITSIQANIKICKNYFLRLLIEINTCTNHQMKSIRSKFIQITLVGFLLFFSSLLNAQTYAALEDINENLLEKENANKNWGKKLGRGDLALGYAHMSLRFAPTSVNSTLPNLPEVQQDLPAVNLQSGFTLQVNYNLNGRAYLGFNFSYLFSTKQESRKRDNAGFGLATFGYRFPLEAGNENHFFSLETGFGFSIWQRPLTNVERHRFHLSRSNLILAPSVGYDINIYQKKIYLFFKYRFVYELSNIGSNTGFSYQDKDSSSGTNTVGLDHQNIKTDLNAELNLGNLSEFSVGFRFFISR